MNIKPYFRSTDFEKSLILSAAGHIIDTIEWDYAGRKATFVFEDELACLETLNQHKRRKLSLNSADVLVAYRDVKNELFGSR